MHGVDTAIVTLLPSCNSNIFHGLLSDDGASFRIVGGLGPVGDDEMGILHGRFRYHDPLPSKVDYLDFDTEGSAMRN
jgi:hypothetical protein